MPTICIIKYKCAALGDAGRPPTERPLGGTSLLSTSSALARPPPLSSGSSLRDVFPLQLWEGERWVGRAGGTRRHSPTRRGRGGGVAWQPPVAVETGRQTKRVTVMSWLGVAEPVKTEQMGRRRSHALLLAVSPRLGLFYERFFFFAA